MIPKTIRTKTEKILYPIALGFSALVWLALVLGFVFPYKPSVTTEQPCVWFDEEIQAYDCSVFTMAETYEYTTSCLEQSAVPPEEWQKAVDYVLSLEKTEALSFRAIFGVIWMYVALIIFFIYATNALAMAHIRLNGVRLSPTQYPAFYKIYAETAKVLGLNPVPHAYVIRASGEVNAFAIKISHKRMVVFFAELIEELVDGEKLEELNAVAAHELTHVKLKHVNYWIFLLPWALVPFLGKWLSRAREYSSDRGAQWICKNKTTVSQALLKLVTGKFVAKEVDIEEYVTQLKTERGFFVWLLKIISTHPPIPKRIQAIKALNF